MHAYVVIGPKAMLFKSEYMVQLTIYTNVMYKTLCYEHDGKNIVFITESFIHNIGIYC